MVVLLCILSAILISFLGCCGIAFVYSLVLLYNESKELGTDSQSVKTAKMIDLTEIMLSMSNIDKEHTYIKLEDEKLSKIKITIIAEGKWYNTSEITTLDIRGIYHEVRESGNIIISTVGYYPNSFIQYIKWFNYINSLYKVLKESSSCSNSIECFINDKTQEILDKLSNTEEIK